MASSDRPFVSIALCAYNEQALIKNSLEKICSYMKALEDRYRWEIVVINDGSTDKTGKIIETFAERPNIHIFHHETNQGLGKALQLAFRKCEGDYIVTLDADLSCAPFHIGNLLLKCESTKADLVIASPTLKGGKMVQVPPMRRFLSVLANKLLSLLMGGNISNFTCMVRCYRTLFIKALPLRFRGMEIMPEIIYKATILGAHIEEIPAILDWTEQKKTKERRSSMRIFRHAKSILQFGLKLHPLLFFSLFSLLLLCISVIIAFSGLTPLRTGLAAGFLFSSIQLASIGILSALNKHHFEEIDYLFLNNLQSEANKKKI